MSNPTFEQLTELHEQVKAGRITRESLQAFLRDPSRGEFPSLAIAGDLIPKGFKILEDAPPREFDVAGLKFISHLKERETHLTGTDLRVRAVELKGNFSFGDGAKMLKDQTALNAVVPDRVYCIPLTATLFLSPDGGLYLAYLYRNDDGRWCMGFCRVSDDWHSYFRLPCCKS